MYLYKTLGELIKEYREKASLSLTELSHLAGISKGCLSMIENGETKRPALSTIKSIASVLTIPYKEIIEYYVEVEQRVNFLYELLLEATLLHNTSLASKIARKLLQSPNEDTYELLQRLYVFTNQLSDASMKLTLYHTILRYARDHGVPAFVAKSLLQKYLIERMDLKRMEESFKDGEEILHYIDFLSNDDKIVYYFRMALQAFIIKKYEKCIELCNAGLALDMGNSELAARAYLAMINSYYFLGDYEAVENHLNIFEKFDYDFVQESTKINRAATKAKKKEYDVAIPMLKTYLWEISQENRIHVANELLEIYLETGENEAIFQVLNKESQILPTNPQTPYKLLSLGVYYQLKGAFLMKMNRIDEGMQSYVNSLKFYGSVSGFQEITKCMNEILSFFANQSVDINVKYVVKLKHIYDSITSVK